MKNIFLLFIGISLALNLSAQKETRKLDHFSSLKVSGGISVELLGGNPSAEVEVTKGELDELVTEIRGEVLHIKFEKKGMFNWNSGNRKAKIVLSGSSDLEDIDVSAGAYVNSKVVMRSPKTSIDASSGASVELEVECNKLTGSVSSGGSIKVSGISKVLKVESSSGGSFNGKALEAKEVHADASSGGVASVWVTEHFVASASSGGSVKYMGNPATEDIDVGKYSGGSVKKL